MWNFVYRLGSRGVRCYTHANSNAHANKYDSPNEYALADEYSTTNSNGNGDVYEYSCTDEHCDGDGNAAPAYSA
jgi:hypothetical protein